MKSDFQTAWLALPRMLAGIHKSRYAAYHSLYRLQQALFQRRVTLSPNTVAEQDRVQHECFAWLTRETCVIIEFRVRIWAGTGPTPHLTSLVRLFTCPSPPPLTRRYRSAERHRSYVLQQPRRISSALALNSSRVRNHTRFVACSCQTPWRCTVPRLLGRSRTAA